LFGCENLPSFQFRKARSPAASLAMLLPAISVSGIVAAGLAPECHPSDHGAGRPIMEEFRHG
jgi:hypothetical protein